MTNSITLSKWPNPSNGSIRLYVNGTPRKGVYLCEGPAGVVTWMSSTKATGYSKYRTGNVSQKMDKDADAAHSAAEIYGLILGQSSWAEALAAVDKGVSIEAPEAAGDAPFAINPEIETIG